MEKNFLKDVVPPAQKRSIRDIPIPVSRKNSKINSEINQDIDLKKIKKVESISNTDNDSSDDGPNNIPNDEFQIESRKPRFRKTLIVSFLLLIILIVFSVISIFDRATIIIFPKTASAEINETINISKVDEIKSEFELGYRILEFSAETEVEANATGQEYISEKSSGKITVFNEYTTKAQKLIKNTRFQAPNGNIYRVAESISVPGYTEENGNKIPGTLEIVVSADLPGQEYNIGMVDFTIPGFEGQEQYEFFYAKSVTEMTGGFEGDKKIVSEGDTMNAEDAARNNLKESLKKEANEQLPNNLHSIYDEDSFEFENLGQEDVGGDKVKIKMRGTFSTIVIDKYELSEKLAEEINLANYRNGEQILIKDFSNVELKFVLNDEATDNELEPESLLASGRADFQWQVDENLLLEKLAGLERNKFKDILSDFTSIERAEATVFPYWKTKFPKNIEDIDIVEEM